MCLPVDHRENAIIKCLPCCCRLSVGALVVGDVVCKYDDASSWVAERKSANDLAASIIDGRWTDQTSRMMTSGYSRVFYLVEGDLSSTNLPHETLLGACINRAPMVSSSFMRLGLGV